MPVYKNAFKCKRCPENSTEQGCPVWVEFMQTDIANGREKLTKMCGFQAWPIFAIEVLKASNRPAAAFESFRNELTQRLDGTPRQVIDATADMFALDYKDNGDGNNVS